MFKAGDIITYSEMCGVEQMALQRGMHFGVRDKNVFLMSTRYDAPFKDRIEEDGKVLIYEGHNVPRSPEVPNPNLVDQPLKTSTGKLTENGRFFEAAQSATQGSAPIKVRVYEKLRSGIWVFNGVFELTSANYLDEGARKVFKFHLRLAAESIFDRISNLTFAPNTRIIPAAVKQEVYKRDAG